MSEDRVVAEVEAFVQPVIQEMNLELVEVQFRREGGGWILRLFIDREGGVTVDDCAALSRQVSAYLEVEDIVEHAYTLEVSSPGVERPLKRQEDYVRFSGRKARIKLRDSLDGQRVFIGILGGLKDNILLLDVDGQHMEIDLGAIARARLIL